ncbi:MAG: hypothetical protein HY694_18485 [Deltaproteobacteria bacterium]|nr:hypothetical protein [Deltaproteobacteria bacterium]
MFFSHTMMGTERVPFEVSRKEEHRCFCCKVHATIRKDLPDPVYGY